MTLGDSFARHGLPPCERRPTVPVGYQQRLNCVAALRRTPMTRHFAKASPQSHG
jgi:hypothetical protein